METEKDIDKALEEAWEKSFQRDEIDHIVDEITPEPIRQTIEKLREKTLNQSQGTQKSNKVYIFKPSPNGLDEDAQQFFLDIIKLIASGGNRETVKHIVEKYQPKKDAENENN